MIDAIIDDGYIIAGKLDRNSVISKRHCHLLLSPHWSAVFVQSCIQKGLSICTFPSMVMTILLVCDCVLNRYSCASVCLCMCFPV